MSQMPSEAMMKNSSLALRGSTWRGKQSHDEWAAVWQRGASATPNLDVGLSHHKLLLCGFPRLVLEGEVAKGPRHSKLAVDLHTGAGAAAR